MMDSQSKIKFSFLIIISMIIWGGSWVSAKVIVATLPPETLTFWRFFISFIAMLPVLFFLKGPMRVTWPALGYTLMGSASMGLYLYLFFEGLRYGFAGAAGVLVTTTVPIATFGLSLLILKKTPTGRELLGLTLGLAGGGVLLEVWTLDGHIFSGGNVYFLLCAVLWALVTVSSQKAGGLISPFIFSLLTYAFCSLFFLFLALPQGVLVVFEQGTAFWMNMLYLAVISSTFATTVYFFASSRLSSNRASSFVFLVPSCAVVLSWIFLGETPKLHTIAGGLIAILATYLINRSTGKRRLL